MKMPGFLPVLQEQLASLSLETLESVNRDGGLEIRDLFDFLLKPKDYTVQFPYSPTSVLKNEDLKIEAFWRGKESLSSGETALCISVDKSHLENMPGSETSVLEFHLRKCSGVKHVWLLVSHDIESIVKSLSYVEVSEILVQYRSFSLNPDNTLHLQEGSPILHDCGAGDLVPCLTQSGVLSRFLENGGKHVMFCEGDNVLAGPHPVILGQHILASANVTCELTHRKIDDQQGIFCEHAGYNQLVEKFRISSLVELEEFPLSSAETIVFKADLDFSSVKWKWHRTKNRVQNRLLIQYKRSLYDLTASLQTQFIATPRHFCYMSLAEYASLKK